MGRQALPAPLAGGPRRRTGGSRAAAGCCGSAWRAPSWRPWPSSCRPGSPSRFSLCGAGSSPRRSQPAAACARSPFACAWKAACPSCSARGRPPRPSPSPHPAARTAGSSVPAPPYAWASRLLLRNDCCLPALPARPVYLPGLSLCPPACLDSSRRSLVRGLRERKRGRVLKIAAITARSSRRVLSSSLEDRQPCRR
ncbi:hypothetical protein T492DRAFT_1103644 [Pavlovales sp. CCMP2436]|nr:hypothetical protein T492DRAFT_1103644 [Pavlovales sp. CCMP2436]